MGLITFIEPTWPAPPNIRALTTTRWGGKSVHPYASFNLAKHVGDNPDHVDQNRQLLQEALSLPAEPYWLNQVHSNRVWILHPNHPESAALQRHSSIQSSLNEPQSLEPTADGSYTESANLVCAVLTADCLPVLLCNRQGTAVAAIHVGWRGCLGGILANAVASFKSPPEEILAWLGPAIGPKAYEVGEDLFDAFTQHNALMAKAFEPRPHQKYQANLYQLATLALESNGVKSVYGGEHCTYTENKSFFSYRREGGITGRIASLIWIRDQR